MSVPKEDGAPSSAKLVSQSLSYPFLPALNKESANIPRRVRSFDVFFVNSCRVGHSDSRFSKLFDMSVVEGDLIECIYFYTFASATR